MNQKGRQKATSSVERDFYKFLNNSNFGIDCRNNIDNCILEALYDEVAEISNIKKFCTIFSSNTYKNFFSPTVLQEEIHSQYNTKLLSLDKNDPIYEARKEYFKNKMDKDLVAIDPFEQNLKKGRRKKKFRT